MKKFWKIAGIATLVAILGIAAVGAIAFAQDSDDGSAWPFDFRAKFHEAIANVLGIGVDEYDAALDQAHEQVLAEAVTEGWLTQDQADQMQERMDEGFGPRMRGKGYWRPRAGGRRLGDPLIKVAAAELDMPVRDLLAELQDGKSIADVAKEQGVDPQAIAGAFLAKVSERLNQAVENERLTQERADWMLEQAGEQVTDQLNHTWEDGFPGGFRRGGRSGRFGGFRGQNDS